jgi:hypothetical protein
VHPLFCAHARQVTRCMYLIGWRLALTARGTCRACAVDHFLPGRLKKVGTWKRKLITQCLQRSVTALYMYLLCGIILAVYVIPTCHLPKSEVSVQNTNRKSSSSYSYCFQHTRIPQLIENQFWIKFIRKLKRMALINNL